MKGTNYKKKKIKKNCKYDTVSMLVNKNSRGVIKFWDSVVIGLWIFKI